MTDIRDRALQIIRQKMTDRLRKELQDRRDKK